MDGARLAGVIRVLAAARDLRRKDLAAHAGIDASYVTLILADPPRRKPSAVVLGHVAAALDVPVELLRDLAQPVDDVPNEALAMFGRVLLGLA